VVRIYKENTIKRVLVNVLKHIVEHIIKHIRKHIKKPINLKHIGKHIKKPINIKHIRKHIIRGKNMSEGISLNSPCCNAHAQNKEYDKYEYIHRDGYKTFMSVYTCLACKKKWAIERVIK